MERSPFGRLPSELRLAIYELTLTVSNEDNPATFKPSYSHYSRKVLNILSINDTNTHPLALTQTCRAIRQEAVGLFFKHKIFRIVDDYASFPTETFFDFLDFIGDDAISALRVLEVQFRSGNCICMNHPSCLDVVNSMVDLRKWSVKHPHVALWARLHWFGQEAFAMIDVQDLGEPLIKDAEGYFEHTFGDVAELRFRLTSWTEALRSLTLEEVLRMEAEEAEHTKMHA